MTATDKSPREFWITDNTDNSGYTVETEFNHLRHFGSCNVYHTIEHSAYIAVKQELDAARAELKQKVSLDVVLTAHAYDEREKLLEKQLAEARAEHYSIVDNQNEMLDVVKRMKQQLAEANKKIEILREGLENIKDSSFGRADEWCECDVFSAMMLYKADEIGKD